MKSKSIAIILVLAVSGFASPAASFGQKPIKKTPAKKVSPERIEERNRSIEERLKITRPPSTNNFFIAPIEGNPDLFTILITDAEGHHASNMVPLKEVLIFEAIMKAAKDFARNEEAVGTDKPVTTRFFDKQAPAFTVDVMKHGSESRFFITFKSLTDTVTLDAGAIKRSDKEATAIFHDILYRVQAVK
ncbi:MAG: hypothetical protein L0229_05765 [Blastocatellia bacterium]|nr:hypothetical protein [Blastocatellia bacterium]